MILWNSLEFHRTLWNSMELRTRGAGLRKLCQKRHVATRDHGFRDTFLIPWRGIGCGQQRPATGQQRPATGQQRPAAPGSSHSKTESCFGDTGSRDPTQNLQSTTRNEHFVIILLDSVEFYGILWNPIVYIDIP